MDGVPFKAEAHQERVYAQDLLEVGENRDAAAASGRDRFDSVDFAHRFCSGFVGR